MRVLFALNRLFLPQRVGGVESSVDELACHLSRSGMDVAVMARLAPRSIYGLGVLARRLIHGGMVRSEAFRDRYPIYRTPMMTRDLPEILRDFRPDCVVFQAVGRLDLARKIDASGVPVVLHFRDVEFPDRMLDFQPAGVIANSRFVANRVEQVFGLEASVLSNVFDPDKYRVSSVGGKVVFINPVPKKGLEMVFRLAEENPDIPFLFVEGWPQPKEVLQRIRKRAFKSGNIEWRPHTEDMRTIYANARALLVPSQWEEAWGRVVTEAQLSGIPVIASRIGGLPEAVGDGGLLLPPDDFQAWSSALRRL